MGEREERVFLGEVVAPFGIKGWVKIYSYTDPPEKILGYLPWILVHKEEERVVEPEAGKRHGRVVIAKLPGIDDRDQAEALRGAKIYVSRSAFPPTREEAGEFYWHDLIGMEVLDRSGKRLGRVVKLLETGANDVLVVRDGSELLIPWIWKEVILEVDKARRTIRVDWSGEFL